MNILESIFYSQRASQNSLIYQYIGVGLRLLKINVLLIDAQKVIKILKSVISQNMKDLIFTFHKSLESM